MTMRDLVVRGMLAGVLAGVLATGFAFAFGEPAIELAVAIEEQATDVSPHVHDGAGVPSETPPVSRGMQRSIGLVTGLVVLGVAFGGVHAVLFAFARGRVGPTSDRATALMVAVLTFIAFNFVPFLKYPANPPAVGHAETIAARTAAYVGMLVISVLLMVAAVLLQRMLTITRSAWDASLLAGAGFVVLVAVTALLLPVFAEVPENFPADVLWQFRIASLGTQFTLWLGIGIVFGILVDRAARQPRA